MMLLRLHCIVKIKYLQGLGLVSAGISTSPDRVNQGLCLYGCTLPPTSGHAIHFNLTLISLFMPSPVLNLSSLLWAPLWRPQALSCARYWSCSTPLVGRPCINLRARSRRTCARSCNCRMTEMHLPKMTGRYCNRLQKDATWMRLQKKMMPQLYRLRLPEKPVENTCPSHSDARARTTTS